MVDAAAVEAFIAENGVDERVSQQLRESDADVQAKVLERGDLSEARNPSALLRARIRDATAGTASEADVEKFILNNGIDEQAATVLRSCPLQVKQFVLTKGGCGDGRSPSAIVLSRISTGRKMLGAGMMGMNTNTGEHITKVPTNVSSEDIQNFLQESNVDERAVNEFLACSNEIQMQVVSRGELKSARNPSATLLSRISQIKEMQGGEATIPEEWEAMQWLAEEGIDERAQLEFNGLTPALQGRVMAKGSLQSATNPSAVLLARIKKVKSEVAQFNPMMRKNHGPKQNQLEAENKRLREEISALKNQVQNMGQLGGQWQWGQFGGQWKKPRWW